MIWLTFGIVSKWIVLSKSNLPGIFAIVPFLGNFSLARSVGRADIGVIRMLSEAAVSMDLFFIFAAAGKFHFPASDAIIGFIDQNVLRGTPFDCIDIFVILLFVLIGIYVITSIGISLSISNNWGFHCTFAAVLILLEPIGFSIMAFGRHKPLIRYV